MASVWSRFPSSRLNNGAVGLAKGAVALAEAIPYGIKEWVTNPAGAASEVAQTVAALPEAAELYVTSLIERIKQDPTAISEIAGEITFEVISAILIDRGLGKLSKISLLSKVKQFKPQIFEKLKLTDDLIEGVENTLVRANKGSPSIKTPSVTQIMESSTSQHKKALFAGACFLVGTLVATDWGLESIESILPGQLVWAADAETGEWSLQEVITPLEKDYHGDLVAIQLDGEILEATGNHPFWVVEGQDLESRPESTDAGPRGPPSSRGRWVEARHLRYGDRLVSLVGGTVEVRGVYAREVRTKVYNLNVDVHHTYAVGAEAVLVHNTNGCAESHVLVRHYTDAKTMRAINKSGYLRAKSWVTLPSEVPKRAGHLQIEKLLEIAPGKGTHYIDLKVPVDKLWIPKEGSRTSGGMWQRRLAEPIPVDPRMWKRPPGRPRRGD